MIEVVVRADDLRINFGDLKFDDIDLSPLAPQIAEILNDENRRARLAGSDAEGGYLIEVRDPLDPHRGGNGPPLAPRYEDSRVISNHFVREVESGPGRLVMQDGWSGIPWLAAHAEGAGHLPVRDIIGIDPEADQFLDDVISEYVGLRIQERFEIESILAI